MSNSIFSADMIRLIAATMIAAVNTTPAFAKEVKLPEGSFNGTRGSYPIAATSATLSSENKEWVMKIGDRLALPAHEGDDWKFKCVADGVTNTIGTGCFFDGYIVAGFEHEAVAILCYEGKIPERLK